MAAIGNTHRSPGRRSWWLILLALTGALAAGRPAAQTQPDALSFFKNYFLTGDYLVSGVGLRGLGGLSGTPGIARGVIQMSGVPARAEVVAAFLYWQVVSKDSLGPQSGTAGSRFNGYPRRRAAVPAGRC